MQQARQRRETAHKPEEAAAQYTAAVIGAGAIAHSHLKALQAIDRLRVVAVADISHERAMHAAQQFGIRGYVDYREMIVAERPDIAVITLPHALHMEAALFCAEQQCHVLLEKPMAMNESECAAIIEAARRHQVQLMVGHTQQFLAVNLQAKRTLATLDLGPLVMIQDKRHAYYFADDRPAWFLDRSLSGGGIVMNLGAHTVDKVLWLTGERVRKVAARLSYHAPRGDVEGSALIYMETERGVPISISLSGYARNYRNETLLVYRDGEVLIDTGNYAITVTAQGAARQVPLQPEGPPFELQFQQLLEAIESGEPPACSGEYGRSVIRVIDAVYRSHETGKEVFLQA